jgi:uncharacterized protein (DUF58 family)
MMSHSWGQLFDSEFLAQLDRLAVASKRAVQSSRTGVRASHRLGDGLEFADHRDYAPGDNVRWVDWRYFARMDRLLTRLFHEHREGGVAIFLDCSASMNGGDQVGAERSTFWVRALRMAAILAYISVAGHERVWLCGYAEDLNEPFRVATRREDMPGLLEALADMTPCGRANLRAAIRRYQALSNHPGAVIIISDLLDAGGDVDEGVAMLKLAGCDVSVLHVTDTTWVDRMRGRAAELVDAETSDSLSVTITDAMVARFRQQQAGQIEALRRTIQGRGANYVPAPLDEPLDELVLLRLRQGGVLISS